MRKFIAWLPLLLVLFWPLYAHAIINVEDISISEPDEGISGQADASANGNSGNSNKLGVQAGIFLQSRHDKHINIGIVSYAYGKSQGRTYINRGFLHARHRLRLSRAWSVEGFLQAGKDDFARLSFRGLAGGGLRWRIAYNPGRQAVYLGLGAMFERERLKSQSRATDALATNALRGNTYLVLKHQLNEHARILSITYYQPDVSNAADFRLLENVALNVKLTESTDLKLSLEIRHDSRPPQQVKRTDITYASGIEFHF